LDLSDDVAYKNLHIALLQALVLSLDIPAGHPARNDPGFPTSIGGDEHPSLVRLGVAAVSD